MGDEQKKGGGMSVGCLLGAIVGAIVLACLGTTLASFLASFLFASRQQTEFREVMEAEAKAQADAAARQQAAAARGDVDRQVELAARLAEVGGWLREGLELDARVGLGAPLPAPGTELLDRVELDPDGAAPLIVESRVRVGQGGEQRLTLALETTDPLGPGAAPVARSSSTLDLPVVPPPAKPARLAPVRVPAGEFECARARLRAGELEAELASSHELALPIEMVFRDDVGAVRARFQLQAVKEP